jgi:hypothetical protein
MFIGGNMVARFNRALIMSINNTQPIQPYNHKTGYKSKKVEVPEKETFRYVFEKAKRGNEMAAVLLDEWQRLCEPKNEKEVQIVKSISKAINKIF